MGESADGLTNSASLLRRKTRQQLRELLIKEDEALYIDGSQDAGRYKNRELGNEGGA